jgi:hypothetical protein
MQCLFCQTPLPFVAQLFKRKFCSVAHQDSYLESMNREIFLRLVEARIAEDASGVANEEQLVHVHQ